MAFSGSSTSSPRRREKTIRGARSAISASGKPSATPAAIAASALSRLWASTNGNLKACSPTGARTSASVSPASANTQVASTSPPPPNRSSFGARSRWGSSAPGRAGTTAVPPGRSPSMISALVAAIASIEPSSSM